MTKKLYGTNIRSLSFPTLVVGMLSIFLVQLPAQAQQSEDRGLLGNFADGQRDGLAAGASDYRNGNDKYAYCPGGTAGSDRVRYLN